MEGNEQFQCERLGDGQIAELLSFALSAAPGAAVGADLERLTRLAAGDLVADVRRRLEAMNLTVGDGARLIGVAEASVRRWYQTAGPMPERARQKLAGLCWLLNVAEESGVPGEGRRLVREALDVLKREDSVPHDVPGKRAESAVASVFGAVGLAAVAMYEVLHAEEEGRATKKP